jgi:hypothetical protein
MDCTDGGNGVMGVHGGPKVSSDGLVLALDGANLKSFRGEATVNYYSTPETLTNSRTGSSSGMIYTDFTTDGPQGGRFTRVVRNTSLSRTSDWDWQIGYSNIGLSIGQQFAVSFYARCPNGTLSSIRLSNPDVEGQTFDIDTTWRRFTKVFTYGAQSGLTFFRFNRGHTPAYVNGATYDLALLQIEAKPYSTSFINGTRGTTVAAGGGWADLTGNGNHGELVNGVRENSANGGSLLFDGVNDYTNHSSVLSSGQQKYTISAWWKTSVNNRIQVVWEQNTSTVQSNTRAALLFLNANWGFNGENNDAHDKVPVRINQWTNGVITIDTTLGTNPIKIYENGFLYWQGNTGAGASNLNVGNFASGLGRKISSNSEYFIGNISQVSIYNRALTPSEIQQNFNATRSRFGI